MKSIKRGFTIIEVIVALAILSIIIVGVVRAYMYMLTTNKGLTQNLNFQNYSQYVASLIDVVDVSAQPIGTPFYLKYTNSNTIVATNSIVDKKGDLHLFAFKDNNFGHEFIFVGTGSIEGTLYNIYTLETYGPNSQLQKTYVTK